MSALCNVVLTGAGGFLGSHLLSALVASGHRVLAVTSKSKSDVFAALPGDVGGMVDVATPDGFDSYRRNLSDALVISCAFPRGRDGVQMAQGLDFVDRLLAAAVDEAACGFVNVSSQSVYPAIRETSACEGNVLSLDGSYAVAKRGIELLVRARCEGCIPFTSIRLASLVGPGFNQRVVNKMARRALEAGVVDVARPNQVFDYMDVRDAVSAFMSLAESDPLRWDEVYNLGSGNARTLREIADAVAAAVCAQGKLCEVRVADDDASVPSSALDASRFCEAFGWEPAFELEDTVRTIVKAIAVERIR